MAEITVAQWKQRINRTIELRKKRLDEAARFIRAYTGDYNKEPRSSLDDDDDKIAVNFIYSFIETVLPSVFYGMPRIYLDPRNPQSEATVHNLQATVNYWFRELGLKGQFKKAVWHHFTSWGAFLTEWDFQEVPVKKLIQPPPLFPGMPNFSEPREVTVMETVKDQPLARYLDPADVLLDPDSKDRSLDRWRGYQLLMTKQEFDRLPGVGSDIKKQIEGKEIPEEAIGQPTGRDRSIGGSETEWVTLYKIYDLENGTVKLLPMGEEVKDYVDLKPWPYHFEVQNDPFPISILEGKIDTSNPYPFSEFKAYWPQIKEKNNLRTMFQAHVRRHAPGWIGPKGAMDEAQKRKFLSMKIGEYVEANKPEGIKAKPLPEIPADFMVYGNQVAEDLLQVSSFNEFQAMAMANTATEASIQESRGQTRKNARKEEVLDFVGLVGGKIAGLCQQFQSVQISEKIKNPKNPREMIWVHATKQDIQGEFSFDAKAGDMQVQDEGLRRQQFLKWMELASNNKHADQRRMMEKAAQFFDLEPEDILRPIEEVMAEEQAMAAAEKEPNIKFDKIKMEDLPPEVQAMVLHAGMEQNDVKPDGSMGPMPGDGLGGVPPPSSMSGPTEQSIMPGMEMNQAPPPMPAANMPPATPVNPMSEMQGG